ncbi:serine/threonine protein kinase [Micromonospora purpureochromogenes]|uniref:non-specific serine/threonine protein kinase n=1 Tax=Micromonospora purpureochromogenes TaxID=47872 RepID=A0A1C4Z9B7_9ACTN|nr:serine/threonine-protein kinase [Micromonospora purpureochromogenes]SCF29518.1 serine/threonine protein kinase [Micromonospora purpureochromogenes]
MQGTSVQLKRLWKIGERLGGGGFGQVYAATCDGEDGAIKFVRKLPGAQRELLFVDLGAARNIVPVIDQGETDDAWVIVMPRAEKSLRDLLDEAGGGGIGTGAGVGVLTDIAQALGDLSGRVVHRDLKPENVLLVDGRWCLADFGISRFADATTAPDTRKFAKTPSYAAPEQWRDERATSATDAYAFGVIAYELVTGRRPFAGPDIPDLREQHLHQTPALLQNLPVTLAAMIMECLYKQAEARPAGTDLERRLAGVLVPAPTPGLSRLQAAHHQHVGKRAEDERSASQAVSESERRARLLNAARQNYTGIFGSIRAALSEAAPSAAVPPTVASRDGQWTMRLGEATVRMISPTATSADPWGRPGHPPFDVIAVADISLRIPCNRYGYEGRSHALWYCDALEEGRFGWYELAFMQHPLTARTSSLAPFALGPGPESAGALSSGMDVLQVAWPFTRLTGEDLDEVISRWAGWLADASSPGWSQPGVMPEVEVPQVWRR